MTAAELYGCDTDFRAMLDTWVENRECPYPLVELLLERGLDNQADCARWVVSVGRRLVAPTDGITKSGIYPSLYEGYCYFCDDSKFTCKWDPRSHDLPFACVGEVTAQTHKFPSPGAALLWLLDAWKPTEEFVEQ